MSNAEDLLNNLPGNMPILGTTNPQEEGHIVIGEDRVIRVPDELKRIAVQNDNRIETVTFDCPRYWDNHDLTEMNIFIHYITRTNARGVYLAKNVTVDPVNPDIIHFTWTVSEEISVVNGDLQILVAAKKTVYSEGKEIRWYSEINNEMRVSRGLDNSEYVYSENPDIINDLITRMDTIIYADTPILDKSLTQAGLAAESKATGDSIRILNNTLSEKINRLASGSPLVASSISEMTDRNRVYVNTTDGKWYYWNSNSWVAGGIYQSEQLAEDSVFYKNLSNNIKPNFNQKINYLSIGTVTTGKFLSETNIFQNAGAYEYLRADVSNYDEIYVSCDQHSASIYTVTFFDSNDNFISHLDKIQQVIVNKKYTVPQNASYVIINGFHNTPTVCNVIESEEISLNIPQKKVIDFDNGIMNLLSYRPLGKLEKGYIMLTCDDGKNELATYTIPKLKEFKQTYGQNIPVTFGLMSSSQIFTNNTYKTLVQEMLSDYGCSLAIHGDISYTNYSDEQLIEFLDSQKEFLTENLGVEPKSIIFPNHDYNTRTSVICASYFGVCCTGGTNKPVRYEYNCQGERSNLFTFYRESLLNISRTKSSIKRAIDYAMENNKIYTPFWHDKDFLTDASSTFTAEFKQELFEYMIEYAMQVGITFITVEELKNIR